MSPRPHPHIAIPPGAAPPSQPSPRHIEDINFVVTPADDTLWNEQYRHSTYTPSSPGSSRPHIAFPEPEIPRYSGRPASIHEAGSSRSYEYAESPVYMSPTARTASLRPSASYQNLGHRTSRSESTLSARPSMHRGESRPPSFMESSPELASTELSNQLSSLTLDYNEDLRRFQAGELDENDEEWHRLVPKGALEVFDKHEIQRQSVIFEIIKSERDYVSDLELVRDVFIDSLVNTLSIPQQRIRGYISEVFYNLDEILAYHKRMLERLFELQRDQHPLITNFASIVLDTSLAFRTAYEEYIKHYPLSEAYHRKELKRNSKYQYFLSQCGQDPRVRKRDLITFLSRPVTRLPRLLLLLNTVQKHTPPDHTDQETLTLLISLLSDFIKSTQPGIVAAESKVKFWELCESLSYQKGEIIDLDLYDESRTLVYSGPLARRYTSRTEVTYTWVDLHVALLDNYLLLLKPETRSNGNIRHNVISRPIPLEYLRLAAFDALPESRREKATSTIEQARLFDSFRVRHRQMYPFTLFHASATLTRRYTLYASSESERERWRKAMVEGVALRTARQDANMWYVPDTVSEGFFRISNGLASQISSGRITGKVRTATAFIVEGRPVVAVGCSSGIYLTAKGRSDFKRVLKKANVNYIEALPGLNKIVVHSDDGLEAYSLDAMALVGLGTARPQDLDASRERVSEQNAAIVLARVVKVGGRTIVLYATKSFMQVTLHALEAVATSESNTNPRRSIGSGSPSFRSFGEPTWIPKDSHDIVALHKTIGVCAERGIHVFDPTNLSASGANATVIPNFSEPTEPMLLLKQRSASAKPLGLVKVASNELLVVFDELGCYIDRHGIPCRASGYLRWETKATSCAHRGEHVFLFSPEFIEIRSLATGKLVQVIEGSDIRLVHSSERAMFVAMRGDDKAGGGPSDKLVELVETTDLTAQQQTSSVPGVWDEWDM
ncbi:RhoGEF/DH domain-containing protein [Phanerochaete sordida]|uniref:RhoGEF/DH domain-containing protein n=1 Tax=Phanerochaete sordida TaxID=48140 RepID=A0A9P3G3U2_9APHY|nr:RhoGEF/DH domain-containing protein [Phanerochaete sordida]